jgi:hypothetical protein
MELCDIRPEALMDRIIVMDSTAQSECVRAAGALLLRSPLVTSRTVVLRASGRGGRGRRNYQAEKKSGHGLLLR